MMLELILYTIVGIYAISFICWAMLRAAEEGVLDQEAKRKKNRRKRKRKQKYDQPVIKKGEVPTRMIFLIHLSLLCALFFLWLGWGLEKEWRNYQELEEQGTRLTVPLLELKETNANSPNYYARYRVNSRSYTEQIGEDLYTRLRNNGAKTVEVLAYQEKAVIVGNVRDISGLRLVLLCVTFSGVLPLGFFVINVYTFIKRTSAVIDRITALEASA